MTSEQINKNRAKAILLGAIPMRRKSASPISEVLTKARKQEPEFCSSLWTSAIWSLIASGEVVLDSGLNAYRPARPVELWP